MEGMTDGSTVLMRPNAGTGQAVEIALDRLSGTGQSTEPVWRMAEPALSPIPPG